MRRLIIANFDCERAWIGAEPSASRIRARLQDLAPMLAAFVPPPASEADASVEFVFDDEAAALYIGSDSNVQWLTWGANTKLPVTTLRKSERVNELAWMESLWRHNPDPQAARRASCRSVATSVANSLDTAAGTALFSLVSFDAWILQLMGGEQDASQLYILKASHAAAGQSRILFRPDAITVQQHDVARGLFSRFGSCVVERWHNRISDYGQCGVVYSSGEVELLPPHTLLTGDHGRFVGIDCQRAIAGDFADAMQKSAFAAGETLHDFGYAGAFGIDAYAYLDDAGKTQFRSLCEINPRLTFGHVAAAHCARTGFRGVLHGGKHPRFVRADST